MNLCPSEYLNFLKACFFFFFFAVCCQSTEIGNYVCLYCMTTVHQNGSLVQSDLYGTNLLNVTCITGVFVYRAKYIYT